MPIYAYRCAACGHARDVLQKISDPLLTICPSCGAPRFEKQITAAGFQLKGSGWYATDFRNGSSKVAADNSGESDAKPAGDAGKTEGSAGKTDQGGKTEQADKSATAKPAGGAGTAAASSDKSAGSSTSGGSSAAGGCGGSCACH